MVRRTIFLVESFLARCIHKNLVLWFTFDTDLWLPNNGLFFNIQHFFLNNIGTVYRYARIIYLLALTEGKSVGFSCQYNPLYFSIPFSTFPATDLI